MSNMRDMPPVSSSIREKEGQGYAVEEMELVNTVHFTQGKLTSLVCLKKGLVIKGEKRIAGHSRITS